MNTFESATQLYAVFNDYSLEHAILDHPEILEFQESVRQLQRTTGLEDNDVVTQLSLFRYWYSNCPLPTNAQMYADHPLTSKLVKELGTLTSQDLSHLGGIEKSIALLRNLWTSDANPMLDEIYSLADEHDGEVLRLLVRQRNWVEPVQKQVSCDGYPHIHVIAPTDVPNLTPSGLMIVVGSHHRYLDHVFTAPRSTRIVVVSFVWQGQLRELGRSFLRSNAEKIIPTILNSPDASLIPEASHTESDDPESYLEARLKAHYASAISGEGNAVPAVLARLYGDYSVFLDASGEDENLIIDPELDGALKKVPLKDVRPGMFVVLRSDTGADHIEQAADTLLGDVANEYRSSLRSWKAILRTKIEKRSTYMVARDLRQLGLEHATELNVRNWGSIRSIATRREGDFRILMKYLGLEEKAGTLWTAAWEIRAKHLVAGRRISNQLRKQISLQDIRTLSQKGRIDFEHPTFGGARISAFQVESISPTTTEVSENNLLMLLDPMEG